MPDIEREGAKVARLVDQTRAVRWWIDKQIADGKTDEQIEAELPLAAAFITGRVNLERLITGVTSPRTETP
jgi:hypothetical protein